MFLSHHKLLEGIYSCL